MSETQTEEPCCFCWSGEMLQLHLSPCWHIIHETVFAFFWGHDSTHAWLVPGGPVRSHLPCSFLFLWSDVLCHLSVIPYFCLTRVLPWLHLQHQTVRCRENPQKQKKKKKKGNDGFSCFLNARSLTTLLPTVCLCLPHWKEAFQPLIKWILSSWNGSMCVQNKWTHCILKGHSHTSVVMNSEWSWVGTWTCRWVWRLLWSHYKKASSIQDVCHAVKVKLFLVSLWTFCLEV